MGAGGRAVGTDVAAGDGGRWPTTARQSGREELSRRRMLTPPRPGRQRLDGGPCARARKTHRSSPGPRCTGGPGASQRPLIAVADRAGQRPHARSNPRATVVAPEHVAGLPVRDQLTGVIRLAVVLSVVIRPPAVPTIRDGVPGLLGLAQCEHQLTVGVLGRRAQDRDARTVSPFEGSSARSDEPSGSLSAARNCSSTASRLACQIGPLKET